MNRIEVKKVMSDFNSISSRLFQADYDDYLDVLKKMLNFIETTELIKGFIDECGGFNAEIEKDVDDIIDSYDETFKFNIDDKVETSEIYSIIKIICTRDYEHVPFGILNAYSHSNRFADELKEFNHRVVFVLINHIENFLKKVGIEMGLDNNVTYNINGTQVNIANDEATINATQNIGANADELQKLIVALRNDISEDMSANDKNDANECINVIEGELMSVNPNEQTVKSQFKLLKRIDSSVKFASSCCSLLTFADKIYPFLSEIIPLFTSII